MELKIKVGGKNICIKEVKKLSTIGKFIGLMFSRKERADILLFENSKNTSIHSFFVFFDFIVLWLDDENNVLEWRVVKPFSPYENSSKDFIKMIEIPINRRYHNIVTFIVGERFKKKRNIEY